MIKRVISWICVVTLVFSLIPNLQVVSVDAASSEYNGGYLSSEEAVKNNTNSKKEVGDYNTVKAIPVEITPEKELEVTNKLSGGNADSNQLNVGEAKEFLAIPEGVTVEEYLLDCASEYEYNGLASLSNGGNLRAFYRDIKDFLFEFYENAGDITATNYDIGGGEYYEQYTIALIDYSDYGFDLTGEDISKVYFSVLKDNPLLYWASTEFLFSAQNMYLAVNPDYALSEVRTLYNDDISDTLESYVTELSGFDTNYEIALYLHDDIIDKVDYAWDDMDATWAHNIIGFIDEEIALVVCEGYAKVYQLILNYVDINNVMTTGWGFDSIDDLNEAYDQNDDNLHAWNVVQMGNGIYYCVDITWDDMGEGEETIYDYFLAGTDYFNDTHKVMKSSYTAQYYQATLPSLSKADYVTENGAIFDVADPEFEVGKMLRESIFSSISAKTYTGNAINPSFTVTYDSDVLTKNTDYIVTYSNNINPGTGKVKIVGIGDFVGTVYKSFTINKGTQVITATGSYTKTYGASAFSLNATRKGGAKLTYASSNTGIATVGSTGTVTIKGCGIVKITITAAATTYYNSAKKYITITVKPKPQYITTLKSTIADKMTVYWGLDSKVSGYQVQYSTSSSYSTYKNITVSGYSNITKTIGGLISGKKYYVRVRSYKIHGDSKIYGAFSSTKTVYIK